MTACVIANSSGSATRRSCTSGTPPARTRSQRACDRVMPVGLIAPAADLSPDRVETLRAHGTRAVIALSRRPLEHVTTFAFEQGLVG